jgi:hypothetical protein
MAQESAVPGSFPTDLIDHESVTRPNRLRFAATQPRMLRLVSRSELPKWLLSAGSKSTSSPRNRSRLGRQEQQISAAADPVPWREIVDVEFEIIRAAKRQAIAGQRILDVAHA